MSPQKASRWIEVSVEADRGSVDDIAAFMGRYCAGGAVIEERPDGTPASLTGGAEIVENPTGEIPLPPDARVTVKGFLPTWEEETLRKLEIALLLLGRNSPISEPHVRVLEPEDWAESWKAYFPPQHIGQHIVIVPTWREYTPQPGEQIIRLDPGMAFGTGLHATTRLCLIAVERLAQPGLSVLDVGTGSGILAIAAAQLGAHVQALDADPIAVEVAKENVELNGVAAAVQVAHGTLGKPPSAAIPCHTGAGYDLLLVNILAEVIIGMSPAIAAALRAGGRWAASGIIEEKAADVIRAVENAGLIVDEQLAEEHWVALIGHKP